MENTQQKKSIVKTWKPNQKQQLVLDFLKAHANEKFTLAEISKNVKTELATGTTNILITRGLVDIEKNAKEVKCPCCGHVKKVSLYKIAKVSD